MKSFSVLTKNDEVILVEEAFSLKALVFQVFWLIYHKLWKHVVIFLLLYLGGGLLLQWRIIENGDIFKFELILGLIIATFAKTWLIEHLKNNDFQLTGIVVAKTIDEARLKFFEAQLGK